MRLPPAPCSIRAPRVGIRDRPPEPHGNEAREFLRKRFIGKEVGSAAVARLPP